MQSRFHPMFYVILPLAALGFAYQFDSILYSMAIPLAIIAVLFGLYYILQYRQGRPRYSRTVPRPNRKLAEKKTHRQTSPFRVIEGRKKSGDDEPTRYH